MSLISTRVEAVRRCNPKFLGVLVPVKSTETRDFVIDNKKWRKPESKICYEGLFNGPFVEEIKNFASSCVEKQGK